MPMPLVCHLGALALIENQYLRTQGHHRRWYLQQAKKRGCLRQVGQLTRTQNLQARPKDRVLYG